MGHNHDAAVEGVEGGLEVLARLDVQVVDRLVQQEQVAALQHQARQLQAAALAERARADRLEHAVAIEKEGGQEVSGVLLAHGPLAQDRL